MNDKFLEVLFSEDAFGLYLPIGIVLFIVVSVIQLLLGNTTTTTA